MKEKDTTNVMRLLAQKKIPYERHSYGPGDEGQERPRHMFKTLVTRSHSGAHYVFVVPVHRELDLKKAARAVSEKSIAMILQRELLPLTGYIHGGCSPIGMKKLFPTIVDQSALEHETMIFSAGKVGQQVEISVKALREVIPYETADISKDKKEAQ